MNIKVYSDSKYSGWPQIRSSLGEINQLLLDRAYSIEDIN